MSGTCRVCGAEKDTSGVTLVCNEASGVTMTAEELAEKVKAEIREGIEEGWLPANPVGWSELHMHCDANELGGMCDDDDPASEVWCVRTIVRMQEIVEGWLIARIIDGAS